MTNNLVSLVGGGALILDCDGTIAPHVEQVHGMCVAKAIERLSEQAGLGFSQNAYDQLWHQELGKGIFNFITQYINSLDDESRSAFLAVAKDAKNVELQYEEEYIRFSENPENAHIFVMREGLSKVFETAVQNGIPVSVISNANQRVLEATLRASLKGEGLGDLSSVFTAVVGKDTVEGNGYKAKPDKGAIICVKEITEKALGGRTVSLANSIGFGDTSSDYTAFRQAGIPRIIACDNFFTAANDVTVPDKEGMLKVGLAHDVSAAVERFWQYPSAHHHSPKQAKG